MGEKGRSQNKISQDWTRETQAYYDDGEGDEDMCPGPREVWEGL